MKFTLASTLAVFALLAFSSSSFAQAAPAATESTVTPEMARKSIANLKTYIAGREERLADIANDIGRIDQQVEKGIAKVVDTLKSLQDTKDSRTRASRAKQAVIEKLGDAIDYYTQKRNRLREEILKANPAVEQDVLIGDIKVFDDKINNRVSQIVELSQSLAEHKDVKKYTTSHSGNYWGRGWSTTRISESYRQNQRTGVLTNQERKKLSEALRESTDDLKRRNRQLQGYLDNPRTSAERKELIRGAITHNQELIDQRGDQLEGVLLPKKSGSQRGVSLREMVTIEETLKDLIGDIKDDSDRLFRRYYELNRERVNIKALKDKLAAQIAWLEKHGGAETEPEAAPASGEAEKAGTPTG